MSWFNTLTTNVVSLLSSENPNKVLDVNVEEYSHKVIYLREDSLILYAPSAPNNRFELVLHRPYNETLHEAYSLCRFTDIKIAETRFSLFMNKIPIIASACKEAGNSTSLQKICDTIMEHPSWTVTHVVTHLGYSECLTDPRIAKFINSEEVKTGMSPLQLAIQNLNVKMVQALLNNNASLDHFDNEQNSVLHYAASSNKQIINLLCDKSKNTLNSKNKEGYTPLHRACLSDKPECVRALLEAGADVNKTVSESGDLGTARKQVEVSAKTFPQKLYEEDMKYGGTPLHWACSAQVVEDLLSKNCDINIPNFDNRTALHVMVLRNRFECLVALLVNNADCNIGDKDGNTPLHLAVQQGRETMVKALIVFGADMTFSNNAGHLPRHKIACESSPGDKILWVLNSVGAPRCPPDQEGCNTGCKDGEGYNGVSPPAPISPPSRDILNNLLDAARVPLLDTGKKSRLLCLDGGGIRGLVLVTMLTELEKKLDKRIIDCFDWVAGTSTGGILALALSCGKTLQECLRLYFKMKNVAFSGTRPYATEPFENILKEVFGENVTMSSVKKPRLIIPAVLADRVPVDLLLFRNYHIPMEELVPHTWPLRPPPAPEEQLIWQAARATGAAPTYFRSFGEYLDGGLMANNPTLDALTEIHEYEAMLKGLGDEEPFKPVALVLSLGTGTIPLKIMRGEVDVFRPESIWEFSRLVMAFSKLTQVILDQATQADGRVVDRARAWCSSLGISYFRFSPQLSDEISMDEKDDAKLTNMLWETKAYMHSKAEEVDEFIKALKKGEDTAG